MKEEKVMPIEEVEDINLNAPEPERYPWKNWIDGQTYWLTEEELEELRNAR